MKLEKLLTNQANTINMDYDAVIAIIKAGGMVSFPAYGIYTQKKNKQSSVGVYWTLYRQYDKSYRLELTTLDTKNDKSEALTKIYPNSANLLEILKMINRYKERFDTIKVSNIIMLRR